MNDIYPTFYKKFKCIANLCPDSCCKDWDIDVDCETEKYYSCVGGKLGDKIRKLTVTDEYGERVFISNNGKCPFWNQNMLCDIYIGLGEEHLSATCKNFPRMSVDYTDFCEHILSFACPEAARLMLEEDNAYADFGGENELFACENSDDYMSFLLKSRERTAKMLLDRSQPFAYRLADCLEFNAQIQIILNGGEPAPLDFDDTEPCGCGFIFDMHLNFEIMSSEWKDKVALAAKNGGELKISKEFDDDFEKFVLYYIYRYYLEAVNSGDVLYSIKRIICAYIVTSKIEAALKAAALPCDRLRILQRYSKEVEHSYENTERMNAEFSKDKRFSAQNLILMLEAMV